MESPKSSEFSFIWNKASDQFLEQEEVAENVDPGGAIIGAENTSLVKREC